jgi:hypothetical protein
VPLLLTGPLLVLNLYSNPGGLSEVAFRIRDNYLRKAADKAGIMVPSLIADRRTAEPANDAVLQAAATAKTIPALPDVPSDQKVGAHA